MKVDVFIKGCWDQLHWLSYCLQLLQKNWQSPGRFVVMLDFDCQKTVQKWDIPRAHYLFGNPWPDPYMHALWCKATADFHTTTDPILLLDCDTMLSEPAQVEDFMEEGKLIIEYLNWHEANAERAAAQRIWPAVVKRSTGLDLDRDYMVSRPWIFWRSTFEGARKLIEHHTKKPFDEAVYSEEFFDWTRYEFHPFTFCDLETLGLYANLHEPDRYSFREKKSYSVFWDAWSHTHFTPEVRSKLDQLLK